jgi:DUF3089 family protein
MAALRQITRLSIIAAPMRGKLIIVALLATAATLAIGAASASAKTVWLCKPGLAHNPCSPGLKTTVFTPRGKKLRVTSPKAVRHPKIDCFYVYPTVSDQSTLNANLNIDPEERSIALYQAARYSQYCRVFAPMYRQLTLAGLSVSRAQQAVGFAIAFGDVLSAWRDYLKHFNHGRGFVLIGHSQGSGHLIQLIKTQIDGRASLRKRLVSAIILGGNVRVRKGKDVGGDFKHIRACRSDKQLGCVIAWSTFDGPVPPDARFGRGNSLLDGPSSPKFQTLCTNPARLRGGSAALDPIQPSAPFAPGTVIAGGIALLQLPLPQTSTPWIDVPGAYKAHCSRANGANVLQIVAQHGGPTPHPSPDPTWGLHLLDANVALGDLVRIVHRESLAYAKRRG